MRRIHGADLFCGGGGTSKGAALAFAELGIPLERVEFLAINHWETALASHEQNHPWAKHLLADVGSLHPPTVVPSGRLNILIASPECTHWSVARGGKPIQDQKRASPWYILNWTSQLYVDTLLIENVPEFQSWGPLGADGRPLKSKRGEIFKSFIDALKAQGYVVAYRVLNAADYGDATARRRLFILARRDRSMIRWPSPTHSKAASIPGTLPWRPAREIIDWTLEGQSIFERKRPLADATLRRIWWGLWKFGGQELKPFLIVMRGTTDRQLEASAQSVDEPLPTLTASGGHMGLAEPFVLSAASGGAPRPVSEPVPTIVSKGGMGLVDAFIMGTGQRNLNPRSVDDPLPTVMPNHRLNLFRGVIVPPLGVHHRGGKANKAYPVDEPLKTITRRGGGHLVSAHIQTHFGERQGQDPRVHSVEEPLPALTSREPALVEGVLVNYHGQGEGAASIDDPMPTFGTKQQIGLVQPVIGNRRLDIRFRMLQPHELAGAMGFESTYHFIGKRADVIRQIGNAVAVNMAKALVKSLLSGGRT